jgi:hypothetical protein
LWNLSIVRNSKELENNTFGKLELFLSTGEGKETPALLGLLERANLSHWVSPSSHLKMNTDPVSETLFPSYSKFRTMDKVHKPSDSKLHFVN